ncbi:MAG: hypothetical protein CL763_01675 [Chloroflexi bacterium]|nr:hypothetical protein [Chloroflexota bacterium]|tara:strand:- start:4529 stop:5275 length:747 start_codon:yes stop_codon:yes gene_type:complete
MKSQWVNIVVNNKEIEAYVAQPEGEGPFPGVVVAMHVFGIDKFVQGKCDALAKEGYIAVAPYLFHRSGISNHQLTSYKFEDPKRREVAMPLKDNLKDSEIIDDMLGALDHLKGMSNSNFSFGVTGFCIGGRIAYLMSVNSTEFKACADFYGVDIDLGWGEEPSPLSLTKNLQCPVIGFFGDLDQNPSYGDVDGLQAELKAQGKEFIFHRYPKAQHAFNDPYNPVRYDPDASNDAWPKLIDFFDKAMKN